MIKYCTICGGKYEGVQQQRSCKPCKPIMIARSRAKNKPINLKKEKPHAAIMQQPIDIVAILREKRLTKLRQERYCTL